MIKSISNFGKYISVFNGQPAATYINGYSGLQGVGNVRYNTTVQAFEVYDGNQWMTLSMPTAQVGLSPEAENILDWAKEKYQEEQEYQSMADKNPAVKAALKNLNKAKRQLEVTIHLSKEHEKTTS